MRNHLKESIIKNTVSHAYIMAGDKGIGKEKIAREFAMRLICENNHIRMRKVSGLQAPVSGKCVS